MNLETKQCQNCRNDFTVESRDFAFYEKMELPVPSWCPDCRLQRRFSLRNERSFYRTTCGLCNKIMLSTYSPESSVTVVYCPECWWSDKWNPFDYAREYDFSKPFFEQYFEFKKTIPHEALYQANFVNSEYANFGFNYKDCYLMSGGSDNEKIYYGNMIFNSTDSFDILASNHLELCYETIQSYRSSQLRYCFGCEDSSDLAMCIDCRGCVSCFGCVGLHNKQYHIFNKPYSKSEYEKIIADLSLDKYSSIEELKKQSHGFAITLPYRFTRSRNAVESRGEGIENSKNALDAFYVSDAEDIRYGFTLVKVKDSYDISCIGKGGEQLYEIISSFGGSHQIGGVRSLFDTNSLYCEDCHNCNDIVASSGLQKKSYCIFNKQYSKSEYEELLPKIIEHMKSMPYFDAKGRSHAFGDFWPIELSPFFYNETKAQEYFPLTKDQVLAEGYTWKESGENKYVITCTVDQLPDSIHDCPDSIVDDIIECYHGGRCNDGCSKAFKILRQELEFYRRMNIPLPRLCPTCRHMERIHQQNPLQLWHRSCMCDKKGHQHGDSTCANEFETPYSPERPEIVYCEKCYQQEVV